MREYQVRAVHELNELSVRIKRLEEFYTTLQFRELPKIEQVQLAVQLQFMHGYLMVLMERVKRFRAEEQGHEHECHHHEHDGGISPHHGHEHERERPDSATWR